MTMLPDNGSMTIDKSLILYAHKVFINKKVLKNPHEFKNKLA